MAGGPQQQMQDQQQGYGPPPRKGSNAGLFVGIGVGAVVLILIVVAVIASGGPTPQDQERLKAEQQAQEQKERIEKEMAEKRVENEAIKKPMDASLAQASSVFAALQNEDAGTLDALFDWDVYAAYNATLIDSNKDFLNTPLFGVGQWEKGADGRYTGKFLGEVGHGASGLRQRVMDYIKEFIFGAEGLEWERAKTESDNGGFTLELNGTKYLGKKVFVTYQGAGKTKELWLGAPKGTDNVRLLNFVDMSSLKNLQALEAKNDRSGDQRDPYNPDRNPSDPDRNPPDNPDDPPADPDANLPQVAKTGAMPTEPALVNAVNDLKRGQDLNTARMRAVESEPSKVQKKATMGAFIDLLIDAQANKDRKQKLSISSALWEIWRPFVPQDWQKKEMVYTQDFDGQSDSDLIVRRWLEVYNSYKTD
ncbi:MAG: hypothetical protein K8I27_11830 [Planctomycetes bacterium]|nr:hypothetical protein [Planctomycetota bacterium]